MKLNWKKIWKEFNQQYNKEEKESKDFVTWGRQKKIIQEIVERNIKEVSKC